MIQWLSQQLTDPTGGADVLLQYGAIGVLALAGIWAAIYLYRRSERQHELERAQWKERYDTEKERGDRFEEALLALHARMSGEFVSKLTESTRATNEWAGTMRDLSESMKRRGDR